LLGLEVLLLELSLKRPCNILVDFGLFFPLLHLLSRSQVLILLEHLLLHLHGLVLRLGLLLNILSLWLLGVLLVHDHLELVEEVPISHIRLLFLHRLRLSFLLIDLLHHHLLHVVG